VTGLGWRDTHGSVARAQHELVQESVRFDVLGAGPAGLAVGYYARRAGVACTLWEAADRVGGNAVTFQHGDFLFDSGAHRFHDKDAEITRDVQELLGSRLTRVAAPSRIFSEGRWFDFPLSPLNLMSNLGPLGLASAAGSFAKARVAGKAEAGSDAESFADFAIRRYGRVLAERFLLKYSAKLWGVPCERLAPEIAGARLKGLDLRTFLKEALLGSRAKTEHLDGAFFYPQGGYGVIAEALARECGEANIQLRRRVTRVCWEGERIVGIGIDGEPPRAVDQVVSSLPTGLLVHLLDPAPPQEVLECAKRLRHRSVVLVAVMLDRQRVTDAATVYVPDVATPFTRVYEPCNRWSGMSPPGKTSLVAEIPCQRDDARWSASDRELIAEVSKRYVDFGWVRSSEIRDGVVKRLRDAYPVLEVGFREALDPVLSWLAKLQNLSLSGRGGLFAYSHVHNQLRVGKDIVRQVSEAGSVSP
jgi:protoporphyrinogen oxidase